MSKNLGVQRLSRIIRWTQCNHKGPQKREAGGSELGVGDVKMEEVRVT